MNILVSVVVLVSAALAAGWASVVLARIIGRGRKSRQLIAAGRRLAEVIDYHSIPHELARVLVKLPPDQILQVIDEYNHGSSRGAALLQTFVRAWETEHSQIKAPVPANLGHTEDDDTEWLPREPGRYFFHHFDGRVEVLKVEQLGDRLYAPMLTFYGWFHAAIEQTASYGRFLDRRTRDRLLPAEVQRHLLEHAGDVHVVLDLGWPPQYRYYADFGWRERDE